MNGATIARTAVAKGDKVGWKRYVYGLVCVTNEGARKGMQDWDRKA